ncbi:MAG: thiol:disulfide interchange protein [SAR324 cluster bacterium]|nr:thiol:disulfide interchange protein [SAR324 cluster bacterium]MBL7035590.1 thiol:disulfide interchange protein [SAR324 cluster bacterium]
MSILKILLLLLITLCFTAPTLSAQDSPYDAEPLDPADAFVLDHLVTAPSEVVIRWQIPRFYYLYKEKIVFSSKDFIIEKIDLPAAAKKEDPFFGSSEVFYDVLEATIRLTPIIKGQSKGILDVAYQGCWEGGICYPLQKNSLKLSGL